VDDVAAYAGDVLDCASWCAGVRYADDTAVAREMRCHLDRGSLGVDGRVSCQEESVLDLRVGADDADGA
jgi:hypothetical protein